VRRKQLERHLLDHGCELLREGANHTIWRNPTVDVRIPVPHHREFRSGRLARSAVSSPFRRL
jgi:mRNA interferase HicA